MIMDPIEFRISFASPFFLGRGSYSAIEKFPDEFDYSWYRKYSIIPPSHITRSILRRQREFFFGRLCAKTAIWCLEPQFSGAISVEGARCPIFPAGISGSITPHGVILRRRYVYQIAMGNRGIDAEMLMSDRVAAEIHAQVASVRELTLFDFSGCPENIRLTLIFSAKEALFKAIYKDVRRILDFNTSKVIAVDWSGRRLLLRLTQDLGERMICGRTFVARFDVSETKVTTLVICNKNQP